MKLAEGRSYFQNHVKHTASIIAFFAVVRTEFGVSCGYVTTTDFWESPASAKGRRPKSAGRNSFIMHLGSLRREKTITSLWYNQSGNSVEEVVCCIEQGGIGIVAEQSRWSLALRHGTWLTQQISWHPFVSPVLFFPHQSSSTCGLPLFPPSLSSPCG